MPLYVCVYVCVYVRLYVQGCMCAYVCMITHTSLDRGALKVLIYVYESFCVYFLFDDANMCTVINLCCFV